MIWDMSFSSTCRVNCSRDVIPNFWGPAGFWGHSGVGFGPSRAVLGPSWGRIGTVIGRHGAVLGRLGARWACLGAVCGPCRPSGW